ncbi:hypothetical protein SWQG_00007 [Synechococcus phage S-RIP2]|uniref:Uncharacterized protein n=2 Tax=Sednavirus SRIP2 TaxID=2733955 RepID=M4SNV2_9CAUD|nr:hypothetical protein SWQG_00007 [Synechococcus phage S-RIP2]YP_007676330.1 hypothetical protein CYZG_00008 [Cyanophage KBS-P-1A]AGG91304.1 hypothetical protein SWQG_00007 [Synechococcus phage S-RIP2]AGH57703.1 hypothetical protein CYZG_00008 [Cyanophage KBS-P-1A]
MALTQVKSDGIVDGAVTTNKLSDSGVTAGTYGSSSAIPAITVDAKGRVTSASTSSIDSTAITNGTSNVSVAASGNITATRAGTQRLAVTSSGIDVTGTVQASGNLNPDTTNTYDLGTSSKQWRNVYADTLYGDGSNITGIDAQPNGGGSDNIFFETGQTITTSYTIPSNTNAATIGNLSINSGVVVTVSSGSVWIALG